MSNKRIREFKRINEPICHYCGEYIIDIKRDLTVDHKIPVSRGGKDHRANLVISCSRCNYDKNSLTYTEYMYYLQTGDKEFKENILRKVGIGMNVPLNSTVPKDFNVAPELRCLYV